MSPRDRNPTSGSAMTLSIGRKAIRRMDTPAIEPRRPARGTMRRTHSPEKARASLATPIATVTPIPTFQASTGSRVASIVGPRTPNVTAKSDGVSMPKGIAVTSRRPVSRASLSASHVYQRSPTRTPSAVPGMMR